jgi:hypothetical protein
MIGKGFGIEKIFKEMKQKLIKEKIFEMGQL